MNPEASDRPGVLTRYRGYFKQLGPGFLQSACTIGGGTLGACLFLGSFAGVSALWVQPVAMVLGLVVLFMISAVALSTTENPFRLINRHVSPVLGWGWLIATVAANMVWGLPQYNLGTDALTQMVAPGLLGDGTTGRVVATAFMAGCAVAIMLTQLRGERGGRLFDRLIQLVVAGIVLCFGLVFCRLLIDGSLSIGAVLRGFVPSPRLLLEPAAGYQAALAQSVDPEFWSQRITGTQRQTILAATGAAVGINMTFLMPYALRARGWGRDQRELARFDLVTGLFLPFVLVSGFIISAAGATLYGDKHVDPALINWSFTQPTDPAPAGLGSYRDNLEAYAAATAPGWAEASDTGRATMLDAIPATERTLAAATIKHNTLAFADTLDPLFPGSAGTLIFGVGVFFIALSTVLVHMLINGYALQAGFGIPRAVGSLLPLVAIVGPFFWGKLSAYLVIPTSVIGLMLLPVALWGFLLLGRQSIMGADRFGPKMLVVGGVVTAIYTLLSAWAAYGKVGVWGIGLLVAVGVAALLTSPAILPRRQAT
ncbi:MAG: hypothetical protein AAGB29_02950 [Planctomycetota bacterium]